MFRLWGVGRIEFTSEGLRLRHGSGGGEENTAESNMLVFLSLPSASELIVISWVVT